MTTCTRPAANSTPEQLRFPPSAGFTVRADFTGGEISSDLGALLLSAVDGRIGLIDRLTAAISDPRDARYITHPLRDLLKQRVFQIASGYEDGNDADTLRADPLFKLAAGRTPLEADNLLACGATHSRLERSLRRSDIYRTAKDNQRYVVTSLRNPTASALYQQVYCQRGQAENWIKQMKADLKSDRTSASSFLANFARLLLTAAAYVLHQQLRVLGLHDTELASAQPRTVILSLFKIAVRVKQYKDRVLLHLPSACPVKALLAKVCQRLVSARRKSAMPAPP